MVNVHIFQSHEAIWDWTSKLISGRTQRRIRSNHGSRLIFPYVCTGCAFYTNSESIQANMYLLVWKIRLYGQTLKHDLLKQRVGQLRKVVVV